MEYAYNFYREMRKSRQAPIAMEHALFYIIDVACF